jgi:DNA-binding response OmpR family regulator
MPKLILMVDSDASLRRQVARSLTARGYDFQENPDGRDVIEQARTLQPQVMVVNIELPRGSGYAICSKLRKDAGLKGVKVILTSAEATQKAFDDHKKLKLGRADDYLLKPFEVDALVRRVVALLGDEYEPEAQALEAVAELGLESDEQAGEERVSLEDIEEISVGRRPARVGLSTPRGTPSRRGRRGPDRSQRRRERGAARAPRRRIRSRGSESAGRTSQ